MQGDLQTTLTLTAQVKRDGTGNHTRFANQLARAVAEAKKTASFRFVHPSGGLAFRTMQSLYYG